jgi:hypothetical protein
MLHKIDFTLTIRLYVPIRTFFVIKLRLFYVDRSLIIGWSNLHRISKYR